MKSTSLGIVTILFVMIISSLIFPIGLILGVNFILSAMEVSTIPLTFGSCFGAWLILMVLKSELTFSSK